MQFATNLKRCPYFLKDILDSLSRLSKTFQKDNLSLPRLLSLVDATKAELTGFYLSVDEDEYCNIPAMGKSFNDWCDEEDKVGLEKVEDDEKTFWLHTLLQK